MRAGLARNSAICSLRCAHTSGSVGDGAPCGCNSVAFDCGFVVEDFTPLLELVAVPFVVVAVESDVMIARVQRFGGWKGSSN